MSITNTTQRTIYRALECTSADAVAIDELLSDLEREQIAAGSPEAIVKICEPARRVVRKTALLAVADKAVEDAVNEAKKRDAEVAVLKASLTNAHQVADVAAKHVASLKDAQREAADALEAAKMAIADNSEAKA